MLKEYGRVRVKATGLYGTIVEWKSGSDHCEIELDWWQQGAQTDEDDLPLRTFALSEIDELVEVRNAERKAVFERFDTLIVSSRGYWSPLGGPTVVVGREGDNIRVGVYSWDIEDGLKANELAYVESSDAAKLLSAVFATHADRWIERFANFDVLDGYSWTMGVYAGDRYFECDGLNYTPSELTSLLHVVNEMGLALT